MNRQQVPFLRQALVDRLVRVVKGSIQIRSQTTEPWTTLAPDAWAAIPRASSCC
jgi:hypothetical protein